MFGIVSRLAWQKGVDLLLEVMPQALQADIRFVAVGSGEGRYEDGLRTLQHHFPGQVGTFIGFDQGLSHLVEAGSDFFLMPSVFEPCGLNQMYSQAYGTVPVVGPVGGLLDSDMPIRFQEWFLGKTPFGGSGLISAVPQQHRGVAGGTDVEVAAFSAGGVVEGVPDGDAGQLRRRPPGRWRRARRPFPSIGLSKRPWTRAQLPRRLSAAWSAL